MRAGAWADGLLVACVVAASSVAASAVTACAGANGGSGGGLAAATSVGGGGAGGVGGGGGAGGTPPCGNGAIDAGEECDGEDYQGKTCVDFGFATGALVCDSTCRIAPLGCRKAEICGDQLDNDHDGFADCDDPDCDGSPACADACMGIFPNTLSLNGIDYIAGTYGLPHVLQPSCTPMSGNELVLPMKPIVDGTMTIELLTSEGDDYSLSVRSVCADPASELVCTHDGTTQVPQALALPVVAGVTYFAIIDGATPYDVGSFMARFRLIPP